ncbi:hypothetical protein [Parvularcula oceani]|uniref:hypothetical protein n=1 Tax=Parvularcula oceani TaxID=1247963 RepID=UPI0004E0B018|nr:hypothetical protein [Parvularcula oceani]
MFPNPSLLNLSSAMARHAGHVHEVTGSNIARADMPGATASEAAGFAEALRALSEGEAVSAREGRAPISLDEELVRMAQNATRHDMAVTVWSRTLDMVRMAGASPR